MKTVIVYYSQTGFTKQYAMWLAEETAGECVAFEQAAEKEFSDCDTVVFGSWFHAGTIRKLNWFKKKMPQWEDKQKIVFAVGANPAESPEIEGTLRKNFSEKEWEQVSVFYCPGGLCYEKMKPGSKLMMKLFAKAVAGKKNKTEEEKAMAEMIAGSYDISDRKYVAPIAACIKEKLPQ